MADTLRGETAFHTSPAALHATVALPSNKIPNLTVSVNHNLSTKTSIGEWARFQTKTSSEGNVAVQ